MSLTVTRSTILSLLVLVVPLSAVTSAHADTKSECSDAYEKGQVLRDEGKFVRASEELLKCAREACPVFMRKDCLDWRAHLEAAFPTIVVAARTPSGTDVVDLTVSVDGRVVANKLDGRAMPIDPGPHTLRFERAGAAPVEQNIVAREGEKMRSIQVVVGEVTAPSPPPVRAEPKESAPVPLGTWIAGGIGVAALGTFATFGILGRGSQHDLDPCRPGCSPDDVSAVRTQYIVADVALGVAIVSFAVGAFIFATRPSTARVASAKGSFAP